MYEHDVVALAEKIISEDLVSSWDREKLQDIIRDYWKGTISITWMVEDVHRVAKDHGYDEITDDDALEILHMVLAEHDANHGISWDTLEYAIERYLGSKKAGE